MSNKPLVKTQISIFGIALLLTGIGFYTGLITISSEKDWSNYLTSYRVTENDTSLELPWFHSNLFNDYGSMSAAKEKVFIFGNFNDARTDLFSILAFNANDGQLLWRGEPPDSYSLSSLEATSSALYSGSHGSGHITAYNLDNGQILWSTRIPGARQSAVLEVINNIVYVVSSNGYHLVKADTGEILKSFGQPLTEEVLQEMAKFASNSTEQIKPEYFIRNICNNRVRLSDVYEGILRAYDCNSGILLWETKGVIGQTAVANSTVYLLKQGYNAQDFQLLGLDRDSGKVIASAQFKQTILPHIEDNYGFLDNYYISVDEEAQMLYAFLGSGGQLFAFKINEAGKITPNFK